MKQQNPVIRVFVYGTLKPGFQNYDRYCAGRITQTVPGLIQGCLYQLALGYPGLTVGERWIRGVVLEFTDAGLLAALDDLEDYQPHRPLSENEYSREWASVFDLDYNPAGSAWVYRMTPTQVQEHHGQLLTTDEWLGNPAR